MEHPASRADDTSDLHARHHAPGASYEQLHAGFRWEVPARYNIAWDCCGRHARSRERFALYFEDESGATARLLLLGPADPRQPARQCPARAWVWPPAIAWPFSCRSGPRRSSPTWRSSRWAPSRFRCRICSDRTRSPTACAMPARRSRSWTPTPCPGCGARAPSSADLRHVIGVAGARETGVHAWEDLLERASARYEPARHRRRRPGADHLHQRHHRRAEGRADSASRPAGQSAGLRLLARLLPAARRHVLVAGGLGLDRRAVRRAAADAALRPAHPRLSRPVRSGARLPPAGEVRRAQRVPLPHGAEDDAQGGAQATAVASTSPCAA